MHTCAAIDTVPLLARSEVVGHFLLHFNCVSLHAAPEAGDLVANLHATTLSFPVARRARQQM